MNADPMDPEYLPDAERRGFPDPAERKRPHEAVSWRHDRQAEAFLAQRKNPDAALSNGDADREEK